MNLEAPGEFPIPVAVPCRDGILVGIAFKPEDVGEEPSKLAPDGSITLFIPADKWAELPDENKRFALKVLAGMQDPFLARRNKAFGLEPSQPENPS